MESSWLRSIFPPGLHTVWAPEAVEVAGEAVGEAERELDALWRACLPSGGGAAPAGQGSGSKAGGPDAFLRYVEAYTAEACTASPQPARREPALMVPELVRSFKAAVHAAHSALPLRTFTGAGADFTSPPPALPAVDVLLAELPRQPLSRKNRRTPPAAISNASTRARLQR